MTTKPALIFAFAVTATAIGLPAQAETFQWKDSNGRTVISDIPPPSTAKERRSIGGAKPAFASENPQEKPADAPKAGEAPKTMAEKDLEFRKRQQEAKEKAEKQAKEQAAAASKADNCERARRQLATLESNQPVTTYDNKGERQLMDTAQREQEMERARRYMAESCQ